MIVLVGGGTASGKSTLARAVVAHTDGLLIDHDRYYRSAEHAEAVNFDEPASLETELLIAQLDQLSRGEAVELPVYDFPSHRRSAETMLVRPRPLIVVEGILVLAVPELVARADLRVYVDAAPDVRLARRLRRDVAERGRDMHEVLDRYLGTVRPMHQLWVEPSRAQADLVLDGEAPPDSLLQALLDELALH